MKQLDELKLLQNKGCLFGFFFSKMQSCDENAVIVSTLLSCAWV